MVEVLLDIKLLTLRILMQHGDKLNKGWPLPLKEAIEFLNYYLAYCPDERWEVIFREEGEVEECLEKAPSICRNLRELYSRILSGDELYSHCKDLVRKEDWENWSLNG